MRTFNLLEDEKPRKGGSLQQEVEAPRKDSMNIYDLHRADDGFNTQSKLKVFDSTGRSYMVSRTVLTEEDYRAKENGPDRSMGSLSGKGFREKGLEIYRKKSEGLNKLKMSGLLKNKPSDSLKKEATISTQKASEKSGNLKEKKSKKRKKDCRLVKGGHRRSKTGVISTSIRLRENSLKEGLGEVLLSDENAIPEEPSPREDPAELQQIIVSNPKKGKKGAPKKFEICNNEVDSGGEKMVYTNSRNVKGKVFDLFAEERSESDSNSIKARVNVSKKYDSGTNFFIQPGKHTVEELEVMERAQKEKYERGMAESRGYAPKRLDSDEALFSGNQSERELNANEELQLYQKPFQEEDSERNLLYHRFNASELKVKKINEKQGWLESNLQIEKPGIELGKKSSYSRRVVEELKNFKLNLGGKTKEIERSTEEWQRERAREKADKEILKKRKKREVENNVKKRRGHKRNVHSEQLNDYFRDIVQINNYPIEVKQTHQNMTPDISRRNSLNASFELESREEKTDKNQIEDSFEPTTESQSNPFQPNDTSKSKHIQISYENIRSSGQLTNINQLVTPKNHQLKSSFNLENSQTDLKPPLPESHQAQISIARTIDKKMVKRDLAKKNESVPVEPFGKMWNQEPTKKKESEEGSELASDSSDSSKVVEIKRRKKLKKIKQKLISSKSVFLEDNDQNKYGSNQVKKRKIDFHNPEDETDIQFMKNKRGEKNEIITFKQRNELEIRKFQEAHGQMTPKKSLNSDMRIVSRASRRKESEGQSKSRMEEVPMQTQEIIPQTKNTSSSTQRVGNCGKRKGVEVRNSSNGGSLGQHPSFGQGSRNSKISITITHTSNKNSDVNNNIIISHSLQNSGIHSGKLDHQNIFKIESPDINSGSQSPGGKIQIRLEEDRVYPLDKNLDDLRTMNKKNITFNPNDENTEPLVSGKDNKARGNCLDVAIPKIRSSFEESAESFQSEEEGKTASEHPVTENTFGYGMEAVIKQASPQNVFADSLSSFGVRKQKPAPVKPNPGGSPFQAEGVDSKNRKTEIQSKQHPKISMNDHTEFYYERENVGNGDSSFKFSNSDNSSRLKNITPTSNSRDYLRSSNNESLEVGSRRRSKFVRDVLRGKLNSPVRRIQEISEEKEPPTSSQKMGESARNDNQIQPNKSSLEKMRNSELVSLKKKHPRRKRTQLYDNKSAMMMLERSKKISQHNSPVRKKFGQMGTAESKGKKSSKLYKNQQQKKQVMVMKSRRKNNPRSRNIDFVNISQERSSVGERSKEREVKKSGMRGSKRAGTVSREVSANRSTGRNTRKKQSTVDKKGAGKKAVVRQKKGKSKKRDRLRKDTMDTKGSKSHSRVKDKKTGSRNVSFNRKKGEGKKKSTAVDSQSKATKKEKKTKTTHLKSKAKDSQKTRKHGSILEPKQMKRVLEMKIMKYSTMGKVIDTSLEFYDLKRMLGEGSYAKVHLGVSILCGKKVAIKLYEKAKIKTRSSSERIFTEIGILRRMNHRNIVNFIEIFQNPKYIFIVLEYANGGDLLHYLKTKGRFKEYEYRKILQQIIDALEYIHEHKILHRDIKLDNILLTKSGHVKICDFGISRKMHRNDPVFEHIGTPAYIAPEIIREKGYTGFGADIWSLGVMTYMALTGNVPFKGNTIEELHQSILTKEVTFSEKVKLSPEMKRAISGMLVKDPRRRTTLKEICKILDLRPTLSQKKQKDFADEEVVGEIKGYGYPENMIKESLVNDMINHITALYKLLKN